MHAYSENDAHDISVSSSFEVALLELTQPQPSETSRPLPLLDQVITHPLHSPFLTIIKFPPHQYRKQRHTGYRRRPIRRFPMPKRALLDASLQEFVFETQALGSNFSRLETCRFLSFMRHSLWGAGSRWDENGGLYIP
jgi:hypothetical protein